MKFKKIYIVPVLLVTVGIVVATIQISEVKPENLPKFIQADFIDNSKITSISKFRSGAGHDFSDKTGETCRSLKHYFAPNQTAVRKDQELENAKPNGITDIDIFSPVDGEVVEIAEEQYPIGKQIHIRPTSQRSVTIILFHIWIKDEIKKGVKVSAGEKIGVIGGNSQTDLAIRVGFLPWEGALVSYFNVLPDSILDTYKARGLDLDKVILTKEQRDAAPLRCGDNEQFIKESSYNDLDDWVYLSGYIPMQQQGGNQQ